MGVRSDPVSPVIDAVVAALREAFDPDSALPPIGGGTADVRVLAGDTIPLAMWNAHADGGCGEPFLWVRLARRFRTDQFPAPTVQPSECGWPVSVMVEVGVGRCAVVEVEPSWAEYAREAEVSLDDSWRVELALCRAAGLITGGLLGTATSIDEVLPFGPEGGVLAWTGNLYVQV